MIAWLILAIIGLVTLVLVLLTNMFYTRWLIRDAVEVFETLDKQIERWKGALESVYPFTRQHAKLMVGSMEWSQVHCRTQSRLNAPRPRPTRPKRPRTMPLERPDMDQQA